MIQPGYPGQLTKRRLAAVSYPTVWVHKSCARDVARKPAGKEPLYPSQQISLFDGAVMKSAAGL